MVASSSAIHTPVSEASGVGMKVSSWCHAWPGLPAFLTNSIDCMHLTSSPTICRSTDTMGPWCSMARMRGEILCGKWIASTSRSAASSSRPRGVTPSIAPRRPQAMATVSSRSAATLAASTRSRQIR